MKKTQQTEFKTKDFYSASLLATMGLNLKRMDKVSNRFVYFVFDDVNDEAQSLINEYWGGEIRVDPKKLISNIKELKTRLHSRMERGHG